jgi:hypothetical protein
VGAYPFILFIQQGPYLFATLGTLVRKNSHKHSTKPTLYGLQIRDGIKNKNKK